MLIKCNLLLDGINDVVQRLDMLLPGGKYDDRTVYYHKEYPSKIAKILIVFPRPPEPSL